jgi:hypothetical protein
VSSRTQRLTDTWTCGSGILCCASFRFSKLLGCPYPNASASQWASHLQALRIVKFWSLSLECSDMDFSRCEKLEYLFLDDCRIYAEKISSQSLRRLWLSGCEFLDGTRTQIIAPRLNSLQLDGNKGMTPILASMPWLVTATIRLHHTCGDLHGNDEESSQSFV